MCGLLMFNVKKLFLCMQSTIPHPPPLVYVIYEVCSDDEISARLSWDELGPWMSLSEF